MGKTILVPFDGSISAQQALEFSLTMIHHEDRIIMINVQKPQYMGLEKFGNVSKEQLDAYYKEEGEQTLAIARELLVNSPVETQCIVRIGLPSIEITKAAKEFDAHAIVMGSKGKSPVVNNALGSVTYGVIHLSPCPVTIVPFKGE